MSKRMMNRAKRRVLLMAAMVCCAALLAGGTLAFFTAEETAYNVLSTGTLTMILHEETTDGKPFPEEGIHNVAPGVVVDKKVYLENTGNVDFYLRIGLTKTITPAEGVEAELSVDGILLDLNETDWTAKEDGFYYYNHPVLPGEKTIPLFNTVTFAPELGNEYMNAHVEIKVLAQAVQSRNNGDSALTAVGWTTAE